MRYARYCGNCKYAGTERIVWHYPTRQRLCPVCLDLWIRRADSRWRASHATGNTDVRTPIQPAEYSRNK
jgi:hypothetical protein